VATFIGATFAVDALAGLSLVWSKIGELRLVAVIAEGEFGDVLGRMGR
jgi:hypothetical protein